MATVQRPELHAPLPMQPTRLVSRGFTLRRDTKIYNSLTPRPRSYSLDKHHRNTHNWRRAIVGKFLIQKWQKRVVKSDIMTAIWCRLKALMAIWCRLKALMPWILRGPKTSLLQPILTQGCRCFHPIPKVHHPQSLTPFLNCLRVIRVILNCLRVIRVILNCLAVL